MDIQRGDVPERRVILVGIRHIRNINPTIVVYLTDSLPLAKDETREYDHQSIRQHRTLIPYPMFGGLLATLAQEDVCIGTTLKNVPSTDCGEVFGAIYLHLARYHTPTDVLLVTARELNMPPPIIWRHPIRNRAEYNELLADKLRHLFNLLVYPK